ncbi:hypothetical protein C1H46_028841 [Malus baccata]|uniref:Uncharacterized protein n=1 Tax=Malus baccata TaxID=106549 RepID=A0A540LGQ7_MALBA|nr:hypothetical protein C1H46_028841 [Malus baccata]
MEHQPNQAAPLVFHSQASKLASLHVHVQNPPHHHHHHQPQQLPPPNNPNINSLINIINKGPSPDHEAGNHQANPSSSSHKNAGISRPYHQADHDHYHHQHARPLHVVQLPPSNLHSANLILHQQINNWPHHNYNAFVPSAPRPPSSTYYTPPHHRAASADAFNHFHHHHHRADSADAIYYSSFPPHQQLQLQYHNHASAARNQPQPVLHYNNHFAETGIPIQNIEYVPVLLTPAGIDGTWKTGLFECMEDPPNSVMTLLCPCWTFGQIAEIVDNGRSSCATNTLICMLVMLCIFVPCLLSCTYRKKLRNKFDLPESPAPDCISHFLCEWVGRKHGANSEHAAKAASCYESTCYPKNDGLLNKTRSVATSVMTCSP